MSFIVSAACMRLKMPGVAKSVLMQLAEMSNDHGFSWPSIDYLCMRTCWGRSAVIEAINYLVEKKVLARDKSNGRSTKYWISPTTWTGEHFSPDYPNQSASRTSPPAGLVREPDVSSPPAGLDQSAKRTLIVKNNQEHKKEEKSACAPTPEKDSSSICPDDVNPQTWADWLQLRKAKRAPVSNTVTKGARAEADKAGMSFDEFLSVWCTRGSQGLEASWLNKGQGQAANQPAETFRERDLRAAQDLADDMMGRPRRSSLTNCQPHARTRPNAYVVDVTPTHTRRIGE